MQKSQIIHHPQAQRSIVWTVYISAALITLGLYSLPVIFPAAIGTGYILLYAALMLLSLLIWQREWLSPKQVLGLGCLIILIAYPLPALTSNDAQRYLWDGAVFLSGFDPYIVAPNSPEASELRQIWPTPEEHAAYPTLYPPGALALFGFSALAGPAYGQWLWKALATLAAIASLFLIYNLLQRRNALKALPLTALSPLLLFETGAGLHLDIFSVLGVSAALFCIDRKHIILAGVIIGLAASLKFLPAVMAGPLLFYLKPAKAIRLFLAASIIWAAVYLLMFGLGYKPLGLLPTFFEKWRGGAPLYPLLEALPLSKKHLPIFLAGLALIGFTLSAYIARKGHIIIAIIIALATPLLLSPILFPWYLMTFVPLLALRPNITLLLAVSLAPLSYQVLNTWLSKGLWEPMNWPSALLLIGLIIGLIFDFKKWRSHAHHMDGINIG